MQQRQAYRSVNHVRIFMHRGGKVMKLKHKHIKAELFLVLLVMGVVMCV